MIRDLGVLWEWEHDERFVKFLDSTCYKAGKTSYLIAPHNLEESIEKIRSNELKFRTILDRATDTNEAFEPILHQRKRKQTRIINDPKKVSHAICKARMHLEFVKAGLNVPFTLILSKQENIEIKALDAVGTPFVIKPAEGGGGDGVVMGARAVHEILKAQADFPEEAILIQKYIVPKETGGKRCWFRVFFVCGEIIPCFWNDLTRIYRRLPSSEEKSFKELISIVKRIHKICGLEFFSTEIALSQDGKFMVVDYANDQCDLRFQSDTPDGVPDAVIKEIANAIVTSL